MTQLQRFRQFVRSTCDEFMWPWQWEMPPPPSGGKKKTKSRCDKILSFCQISQYFLAAVAIVTFLAFERSRQLFVSSALEKGLALFIAEIFVYIILGYVLGQKRVPANYISLVIISIFVVLEDRIKPIVDHYEVEALETEHWYENVHMKGIKATAKPPVKETSVYARSCVLLCLMIGAYWVKSKFTKFDVLKYKEAILICLNASSWLGAMLLISTFSLDAYPQLRESHRKFCEIWIIFSVTTLIFVGDFLFVKLLKILQGEMKPDPRPNSIIEWEVFVFLMVLAITIRYIPAIHADSAVGFSIPDVLSRKTMITMEFFIPNHLMIALNYVFDGVKKWI